MIFDSVVAVSELTRDSDEFCLFSDANKVYTSTRSFLFTLYNVHGFRPQKLTIYRNYHMAIYARYDYGPTFGAGFDLHIVSYANIVHLSYTNIGHTYNVPYGCYNGQYHCSVLTGTVFFFLSDIEVWYETI